MDTIRRRGLADDKFGRSVQDRRRPAGGRLQNRNYGIYFDIEKEERLINAGLEEYRSQQAYLAQERAKEAQERARQPDDTAADEGAEDFGAGEEFESLLKRSDYRKYQALLRQLWGK